MPYLTDVNGILQEGSFSNLSIVRMSMSNAAPSFGPSPVPQRNCRPRKREALREQTELCELKQRTGPCFLYFSEQLKCWTKAELVSTAKKISRSRGIRGPDRLCTRQREGLICWYTLNWTYWTLDDFQQSDSTIEGQTDAEPNFSNFLGQGNFDQPDFFEWETS
jgi:hypothetical protein